MKKKDFSKDDRVEGLFSQRGDYPGILHIFSAMETCTAYNPWHDKKSNKTFFLVITDFGELGCFKHKLSWEEN
jgi:hypothetical protein